MAKKLPYNIRPTDIADRLVTFREAANKSVQDIVRETSISRSGILKMESAQSNPTLSYIAAYVTACGKTLSDFFAPWQRQIR